MLVTSQLPIQTTKFFYSFFNVPLCPPTFKKIPPPIRMDGWLRALMQSDCLYSLFFELVRWQGPVSVQYRPYNVFLLFPYLRGVLFKNLNDPPLSFLGNPPNMQIKAAITENPSFANISVTMHGIKIILVSIPMFWGLFQHDNLKWCKCYLKCFSQTNFISIKKIVTSSSETKTANAK